MTQKESKAAQILQQAAAHMIDRASTYDNENGERSIPATVEAFNAITGHDITAEQGWLFVLLMKLVRSQQGDYKADNYEDSTAYAALMGEQAASDRMVSGESPTSPDDWEAGEKRMEAIGQNGPTAEHYPDYTGFIDGYGTIEIGDHLPELGGYLIGFIDGHGIIMPDDEFIGVSFWSALGFVANLDAITDGDAGEFNDWRVPTKDELNLAWINREKLAGLGMSQNIYWSATECSDGYAWHQYFGDGTQYFSDKNVSYRVRPVRSVPMCELTPGKQ